MAWKLANRLMEMGAQFPLYDSDQSVRGFRVPEYPGFDLDGDGLMDSEEDTNRNGTLDAGESHPDQLDTDFDGGNDFLEWASGLNPNDPDERFDLSVTPLPSQNLLRFVFPSRAGFPYTLESSTSLDGDWNPETPTITGSVTTTTMDIPVPTPLDKKFYRIRVNLPE